MPRPTAANIRQQLAAHGVQVSDADAAAMRRAAGTIQRAAEYACSGPGRRAGQTDAEFYAALTAGREDHARRAQRAEDTLTAYAARYGFTVALQDDPRGWPVEITTPDRFTLKF